MVACLSCDKKFKPLELLFNGKPVLAARHCPDCVRKYDLEEAKKTKVSSPESLFNLRCPALYQNTDKARLNPSLLQQMALWRPGSQGLLVAGASGTGKTRAMWLLIRHWYLKGYRFAFTSSADFRAQMDRAAQAHDKEGWMSDISKVDLWFFDDLGQMSMTQAASEALLAVVEKRTANEKPILVTTNYSGEEIAQQFERPQMGFAVYRRLKEFCRFVQA